MNNVVVLAEVQRRYGQICALNSVSLTIANGEAVALVGPSGSGKSTLLNLMGTLDRPTAGLATIDGFCVDSLTDSALSALRSRSIGFVFQQFHLAEGVSAINNVADGLIYAGVQRKERKLRAAQALHRVGLTDRLNHKPHQLSGGERQRVAIARAIISQPRLLLADEPTGNLDSASGNAVIRLLQQLNNDGTTVVVVTHDQQLAESFPRQIQIKDGSVHSDRAQ